MSGSAPCATPVGVGGADRDLPLAGRPAGAHSMSVVDGPCAGLKKHGGRRVGSGWPDGPGVHAGDGVAAVLERLGDVPDVLGPVTRSSDSFAAS